MKLASQIVYAGDGAGSVIGVGGTASAAVQFGKAVGAFFVGIDVTALKLVAHLTVGDAVVDIAQQELSSPTNW